MSTHKHVFMFDENFSFGHESVFTNVDNEQLSPFPPIEGYFLLTDGTDFLLTDSERLALA